MKTTVPSKKRGSTLVILMAILVAFTLMVAALLRLGSLNEIETVKQLRTTQAHWTAEAGLEKVLSWLKASEYYRNNTGLNSAPSLELNEDLLGMADRHYWVWVSKKDVLGTEESTFSIVSTGGSVG